MTNAASSSAEAAVADANTIIDAYEYLYQLTFEVIGVKLFTIMTFDMKTGKARRSFTSNPEDYPVSGEKDIKINSWYKIVHDQRKTFVANSIEEIDAVFPDAELIAQLGCGSVMNIPLFQDDSWYGSVNLLHEPGFFTDDQVKLVHETLAGPLRQLMTRLG